MLFLFVFSIFYIFLSRLTGWETWFFKSFLEILWEKSGSKVNFGKNVWWVFVKYTGMAAGVCLAAQKTGEKSVKRKRKLEDPHVIEPNPTRLHIGSKLKLNFEFISQFSRKLK